MMILQAVEVKSTAGVQKIIGLLKTNDQVVEKIKAKKRLLCQR